MVAPVQASAQKMTLRRFVRVTIDNFRQLLQNISAPATSLPMPSIIPPSTQDTSPKPVDAPASAAHSLHALQDDDELGGSTLATGALVRDGQVSYNTLDGQAANAELPGNPTFDGDARGNGPTDNGPTDDDPTDTDPTDTDPTDRETTEEAAARATGEHSTSAATLDKLTNADPASAVPDAAALSLAAALESLLFVSDEAVEPAQLARAIGIGPAEVETALLALDADYRQAGRGLRLQVRSGRYQLVTAPAAAALIETFLNLDTSARLSAPALEALAVVAYRQPVTRAQIEAVRGVDCSGVLRSLLQRGLLEEVGRLDAPGRPVLYGVTELFMHHFGLTALHELPPLETAELARIEEIEAR